MKFFSVRRGALAGVAVAATLAAIPVSNAAASGTASASTGASGGGSGTYVSTSGSLLGIGLPSVSTTLPLALPLDFNVQSTTSLYSLNVDPHMVH